MTGQALPGSRAARAQQGGGSATQSREISALSCTIDFLQTREGGGPREACRRRSPVFSSVLSLVRRVGLYKS